MKINMIFKALSHPIRRDIIARLRDGPIRAGVLADAYALSKPTMSAHFATLKEAELILADRDGVTINYHLNVTVAEEALSAVMSLLCKADDAGARSEAAPMMPPEKSQS